jgi:myo-inositol catabolism protein IolS
MYVQLKGLEMQKRLFGNSGMEVSTLGIGTWSFGGKEGDYWGVQEDHDAEAIVYGALDRGVNFFDTAPIYNDGRSEETLGRILNGRRSEAVIVTKVAPENADPSALQAACEDSLRRLNTDAIDIYLVHWPIRGRSVEGAFDRLMDLKEAGKIRSIGISNFGIRDMGDALATGAEISVNELLYNLLSRAIEVGIAPLCVSRGVGILAYMPLLQGILSGKYANLDAVPPQRLRTRHFSGARSGARHGGPGAEQEVTKALEEIRLIADEGGYEVSDLALAWTLHKPGVVAAVAGTRDMDQLESNCRAASLQLPADVIARLDAATEPVLNKLGASADYWESAEASRTR